MGNYETQSQGPEPHNSCGWQPVTTRNHGLAMSLV